MVGLTDDMIRRDFGSLSAWMGIRTAEPWAELTPGVSIAERYWGDSDVPLRVVSFRWMSDPAEEARMRRERWERREDEAASVMGWHRPTGGEL